MFLDNLSTVSLNTNVVTLCFQFVKSVNNLSTLMNMSIISLPKLVQYCPLIVFVY